MNTSAVIFSCVGLLFIVILCSGVFQYRAYSAYNQCKRPFGQDSTALSGNYIGMCNAKCGNECQHKSSIRGRACGKTTNGNWNKYVKNCPQCGIDEVAGANTNWRGGCTRRDLGSSKKHCNEHCGRSCELKTTNPTGACGMRRKNNGKYVWTKYAEGCPQCPCIPMGAPAPVPPPPPPIVEALDGVVPRSSRCVRTTRLSTYPGGSGSSAPLKITEFQHDGKLVLNWTGGCMGSYVGQTYDTGVMRRKWIFVRNTTKGKLYKLIHTNTETPQYGCPVCIDYAYVK